MTQLIRDSKLAQFRKWFFESDIRVAQGIPLAISFVVFIVWPVFVRIFKGEVGSRLYGHIHLPYVGFLFSFIGIVGIIRKEFYWSPQITIRGKKAVLLGIFFWLLWMFLGILLLVY